jgi:hypothetical protein
MGFATMNQTRTETQTYPNFPSDNYTYTQNFSGPTDSMSLVGFSIGLGIQGGF